MFKVSKIADYAVLIMVYIAKHIGINHKAKDIAIHTRVALPTVSKILKLMAKKGLLLSHRGAKGGYILAKDAQLISICDILEAIDGKFGLTDCTSKDGHGLCALEPICSITSNWQVISKTIHEALHHLKLADMTSPLLKEKIMIRRPA